MLVFQLQRLEKEQGSEEEVLQEVLTLASTEGLLLPLRMSGLEAPDPTLVSSASLHAVVDSSDQVLSAFAVFAGCSTTALSFNIQSTQYTCVKPHCCAQPVCSDFGGNQLPPVSSSSLLQRPGLSHLLLVW